MIDGGNIPKGFELYVEGRLAEGYSYGRLSLENESGAEVDASEFYAVSVTDVITLDTYSGGKYKLKVSNGLPLDLFNITLVPRK